MRPARGGLAGVSAPLWHLNSKNTPGKWNSPGPEEGDLMGPRHGPQSLCSDVTHISLIKANQAVKPDTRGAMKKQ